MDKFVKYIFYIGGAIVIGLLLFILITRFDACGKLTDFIPGENVTVHEGGVITRYEDKLRIDTVVKWHEKIVYKQSKPVIIYEQKIDSVFIEKIKTYDFMLGLEKKNSRLRVFAVNLQDSVIKETYFNDIGNNFSVYSKPRGVFVKSARFNWEGIDLRASYSFDNLKYDNGTFPLGIETEVKYLNRYALNLSSVYDFNKKILQTNLTAKIKLFQ